MSNRGYLGKNGRGRGGGGRGLSTYQRQMAPSTTARISRTNLVDNDEEAAALARRLEYKRRKQQEGEALDEKFQFQTWDYKTYGSKARRGWILNMITTVRDFSLQRRVCK